MGSIVIKIVSALLMGVGIIGLLSYGVPVADRVADGRIPPAVAIIGLLFSLAMLFGSYFLSRLGKKPTSENSAK